QPPGPVQAEPPVLQGAAGQDPESVFLRVDELRPQRLPSALGRRRIGAEQREERIVGIAGLLNTEQAKRPRVGNECDFLVVPIGRDIQAVVSPIQGGAAGEWLPGLELAQQRAGAGVEIINEATVPRRGHVETIVAIKYRAAEGRARERLMPAYCPRS